MQITYERYEEYIKSAKAQAWDEGEDAGFQAARGWEHQGNPYRDAE